MNLNLWSNLAAAFIAGFGAGAGLTFYRSKAQLGLYRHFIEDRLSRWTDHRGLMTLLAGPVSAGALDASLAPGRAITSGTEALLDWLRRSSCSRGLLNH